MMGFEASHQCSLGTAPCYLLLVMLTRAILMPSLFHRPMSATQTYRAFNFPHHVTTYLSRYYAARYTTLKNYAARYTTLKTSHELDWYVMVAAGQTPTP